jgi:hypothetical protein
VKEAAEAAGEVDGVKRPLRLILWSGHPDNGS